MSDSVQIDDEKQKQLKRIIKDLHAGKSVDEVKKDFTRLIKGVSHEEISDMEQSLISEGFPPEEIQRLCEVHVDVFQSSLEKEKKPHKVAGHPVHTYMLENKEAKKIIKRLRPLLRQTVKGKKQAADLFRAEFEELKKIVLHYTRKENQLFPYLEKKGFTGPSKVMWGKHDEIRAALKQAEEAFLAQNWNGLKNAIQSLLPKITKMIFMEERILFPTSLKKLSEQDWAEIRKGEPAIGYAWVKPGNLWDADIVSSMAPGQVKYDRVSAENKVPAEDTIRLDTGSLSRERLNLMLKALPLDISYVDENDRVLYYSNTAERIFPRSPGVIGRAVQNCHPPKSVHVVEQIIESFRNKEKKESEFWIQHHGRFVHIRYLPVYDEKGEYRGVIEVSQDVTAIRNLQGEKRLLD